MLSDAVPIAFGYCLYKRLIRHAIGISESKGAREIVTLSFAQTSLFARVGFEPVGAGGRLMLMPE